MKKRKSIIVLQILNILVYLAMITINALANIIPFNDLTTGEVADLYPNLFTPASITFSIWGVIYLLLAGFVIYQAWGVFKNNKLKDFIKDISWYFIISSLANISWIISWHFLKINLSLVLMLILLLSLIMIYLRLNNGIKKVDIKEKIFVHLPFSIYLSWISIATLANITVFLLDNNIFNYIPEVAWVITAIIIGTIITLFILFKRKDIAYSLVAIWAFIGIILKRLSTEPIISIIATSILGIVLILSTIIYILLKPYQNT